MSDEVTRNTNGESGDHWDEMTRRNRLDDRATDALLSGRVPTGREEFADVAGFAEALRAAASAPSRPNADLAAVLTQGLSTEKGDLPATAGSNVHGPAPQAAGLPKWRTRKMIEIALAKLGALGLAAKVGVASAAVVAGTVGAGAAGVLPDSVQDAVASTVEAVTPFDLPDSADVAADPADPDANDHGQNVADVATTTDAEGCDRGHEIATTAGGDPEECVDGEQTAEDSRPEDPGVEGRDTADENADDNAEAGLDTADDAATNGREFGEDRAGDGSDAGVDDASTEGTLTADENSGGASTTGQDTGDEASTEGQEIGDEASTEGQETGDNASSDGQETGDNASNGGQETGDEASDDFRP